MRSLHWVFLLVLVSGCASIGLYELDEEYGFSDFNNRQKNSLIKQSDFLHYQHSVKPIIENRCVVCHGCYDAPCQLKLESFKGLERGATKQLVYDGSRLSTLTPTTFVNDIDNIGYWRKQGFFPVLNERQQIEDAHIESSVLYQILDLKDDNPLPEDKLLDESFDLSLNRDQQCPSIEEFEDYREETPLAGMPYGLPNLSDDDFDTLTEWIENGAIGKADRTLSSSELNMINNWELLLNGESDKEKLIARYLFEHLYLANLFFTPNSQRFFSLVRSSTPTGELIKPLVTRRPYDKPNADRFYYRLKLNIDTVIAKRHMPYRFDLAKMNRFKALFYTPQYTVNELPSYELALASNPFKTFKDLPVKSRYLFLLDEAQFTIMNFIKGPVCRGQIALNVIRDDFWVFFSDPNNIELFHTDKFLAEQTQNLTLPASTSTGVLSILDWRQYTQEQKDYLSASQAYLSSLKIKRSAVDLNLVWSGQGNPNAALTILRHFDSATVLKGSVGEPPKTAWILNYPLMERIHYLLVAGFDIYGDVSHQLKTRLYMDFLRMEGESSFVTLLPKNKREEVFTSWYQGIKDSFSNFSFDNSSPTMPDSNINYMTNDPKTELMALLKDHVKDSITDNYSLSPIDINTNELKRIAALKGEAVSLLPQVSLIKVRAANGSFEVYSLLSNDEHKNVANLFYEEDRRIPAEDSLSIFKGVIGTYPNAFYDISEKEINGFAHAITNLQTEADYQQLKDKYSVRRTSENFWDYADSIHAWYKINQSDEYGLLDFNRLENR